MTDRLGSSLILILFLFSSQIFITEKPKDEIVESDEKDVSSNEALLKLARQQRMNTDVRRNIFCIIMGSEVCTIPHFESRSFLFDSWLKGFCGRL